MWFGLLSLARISYRRKTLSKISLLPLRFPLSIQFPSLLLGTWTWGAAARQKNEYDRREEHEHGWLFHKKGIEL